MSAIEALEAAVNAAKEQINACDKQSAVYKSALRNVGEDETSSDEQQTKQTTRSTNSVTVQWIQVEGLPDAAEPALTLQLSSPVEEAVLDAVGATVSFAGVETGQATLSVTATDADIPLGSSVTAYDVATFTHELLDALQPAASYETELSVPITAATSSDVDAETTAAAAAVLCTVTLKLTYVPSIKDQREELYELIEKVSKQKAAAREDLRKASIELHQVQQQLTTTTTKPTKKPAVQAGFLNKGSATEQQKLQPLPAAWKIWYERGALYLPLAKNYILFFGFVAFSHFRGQHLAMPAPV